MALPINIIDLCARSPLGNKILSLSYTSCYRNGYKQRPTGLHPTMPLAQFNIFRFVNTLRVHAKHPNIVVNTIAPKTPVIGTS